MTPELLAMHLPMIAIFPGLVLAMRLFRAGPTGPARQRGPRTDTRASAADGAAGGSPQLRRVAPRMVCWMVLAHAGAGLS